MNPRKHRLGSGRNRTLISTAAAVAVAVSASNALAEPSAMPFPRGQMSVGGWFPVEGGATEVGYDATIGVTTYFTDVLGRGASKPTLYLVPELGYTNGPGLDAFNLAFGVGGGNAIFGATYVPRLLLGTGENGDFAVGIRNSVSLHLIWDLIQIEVGHQFLDIGGEERQDMIVYGGINFFAVIPILLASFTSGIG